MDFIHPNLLASFLNPTDLLTSAGVAGLIILIFLESCFAPLPGDSLLFAAGLFASQGKMNLAVICIGTSIAAVAGNQAGYLAGRNLGPAIFNRPNSRIFSPANVKKTEAYFERFGPRTILIARVVPIVRGLAPIAAGVARMRYRTFVIYNVVGGIVWANVFIFLGYELGKSIDNVDRYVLPLTLLVVVVTSLPLAYEYYRGKKRNSTNAESAQAE